MGLATYERFGVPPPLAAGVAREAPAMTAGESLIAAGLSSAGEALAPCFGAGRTGLSARLNLPSEPEIGISGAISPGCVLAPVARPGTFSELLDRAEKSRAGAGADEEAD